MQRLIIFGVLSAIVVCLLAYFGVAQQLGAHPFWAFDVAIYGAVPGIILAMVLSLIPRWGLMAAMTDLTLAGGVAWYGKRLFVASSGDDAFAGQLWFFGWIAVCACAVAVIALVLRRFAD